MERQANGNNTLSAWNCHDRFRGNDELQADELETVREKQPGWGALLVDVIPVPEV